MEKPNQLTRTCTVCGLKKPLASFLQLSVSQGTHYGTICADCRSKQARAGVKPLAEEEWSKAGTGSRIGAKEKVFIDEKKKLDIQAKDEAEKKESNKLTLEKTEKLTKEDVKQKYEKDHRNFFLDVKIPPGISEKPQAAKPAEPSTDLNRPEALSEVKVLQDFLVREQKFRSGEIGHAPLSLNEMKYNTAMFQQFVESFLSEASPLKRFLSQHSKRPSTFGAKQSTQSTENKSAINAIEEFIEKKFGPSRKM